MSRRKKRLPPFETEITHLGAKGTGMGIAPDGRPIAVRRAPVGSRVLVRPAGRKKGAWKGVRTALVRPATDHVTPPCPLFGLCGGCVLQEMPLASQRAAKRARAVDDVGPAEWAPGVGGTDAAYGYRNKMELSFGTARYLDEASHAAGEPIDGRFLGMHAAGRFDRVVDTAHCDLMDPAMNALLTVVRTHALAPDAPPPWNPRAHTGFFRHLQLRRGADGVLLALFTAPPDEAQTAFVEALAETLLAAGALGVQWIVNDQVADVAQGELAGSWGVDRLRMALSGRSFDLSTRAFFQVNTAAAEILYATIGEALGTGHRRLLDLYCGTGSIGITLADHADEVVGVEVVADAIDNARANAAANEVSATYHVGRMEDLLEVLVGGPGVAAVVDPPRVGLHPKVAKLLAETPLDVLVYVACNPASLGRDRGVLEEGGWRLERCWAVDLFPQTGHLEVVARFTR
jgi:23S rRNA (uracil1939-C5)-methyltransferase